MSRRCPWWFDPARWTGQKSSSHYGVVASGEPEKSHSERKLKDDSWWKGWFAGYASGSNGADPSAWQLSFDKTFERGSLIGEAAGYDKGVDAGMLKPVEDINAASAKKGVAPLKEDKRLTADQRLTKMYARCLDDIIIRQYLEATTQGDSSMQALKRSPNYIVINENGTYVSGGFTCDNAAVGHADVMAKANTGCRYFVQKTLYSVVAENTVKWTDYD